MSENTMRSAGSVLLLMLSAALLPRDAAALSYEIVQYTTPGGREVSGTIETDGTLGALTEANFELANSSFSIAGPNGFQNWTPDRILVGKFGELTATADDLFVESGGPGQGGQPS